MKLWEPEALGRLARMGRAVVAVAFIAVVVLAVVYTPQYLLYCAAERQYEPFLARAWRRVEESRILQSRLPELQREIKSLDRELEKLAFVDGPCPKLEPCPGSGDFVDVGPLIVLPPVTGWYEELGRELGDACREQQKLRPITKKIAELQCKRRRVEMARAQASTSVDALPPGRGH